MARAVRHDAEPAACRTTRRRPRYLRVVPAQTPDDFGAVRHLVRADGVGAARARRQFLVGLDAMGGAVTGAGPGTSVNHRSRHSAESAPSSRRMGHRRAVYRHLQPGASLLRATRSAGADTG